MEAELPVPDEGGTSGDPLAGVGPLQGLAKAIGGAFLRPYFRMEVRGADNVPREGAAVLVCNHESMWDIPLLVVACPRPIVFMAKQEVYSTWYKDWFFTRLGGFPVRRGGRDASAMKKALAVIRSGRVLGIYPEGTRSRGEGLLPFHPGAARIALAEGVPIVPAVLTGTGRIWAKGGRYPRPVKVRVAFGEPIEVERERDPSARRGRARELMELVRGRVESLLST